MQHFKFMSLLDYISIFPLGQYIILIFDTSYCTNFIKTIAFLYISSSPTALKRFS